MMASRDSPTSAPRERGRGSLRLDDAVTDLYSRARTTCNGWSSLRQAVDSMSPHIRTFLVLPSYLCSSDETGHAG
ncbi:hypothetical protein LY78DRAFT_663069 [Colletotrichum sublineola]|nr:hypothetical protein LY78DRAFT_663069 [Colletotrichum sublineola]